MGDGAALVGDGAAALVGDGAAWVGDGADWVGDDTGLDSAKALFKRQALTSTILQR